MAYELFNFLKEISEEVKADIEEEKEEIIESYENKLKKCNMQIDDLTRKINNKEDELNRTKQQLAIKDAKSYDSNDEKSFDLEKTNLEKLKVSELKDMAKRKGVKIRNGIKKDEIIRELEKLIGKELIKFLEKYIEMNRERRHGNR